MTGSTGAGGQARGDEATPVRLIATAGVRDGRGHLGRALSMAEALGARGMPAVLQLVEGELSPGEAERAAAAGLAVSGAGPSPEAGPGEAPGSPRTVTVVDLPDPSAVPDLDPAGLVVFDDRNIFAGRAAVVVQPSQPRWDGPGTAASVLVGSAFVPIPAAVRARRQAALDVPVPDRGRRVLVCFGGSDPSDVTGRLVGDLAALDVELEVVVGPSYRHATDPWPVEARRDPPDLVERLAAADLVVSGAGTMKYEAACLGRPMLLLAAADDQLAVGPGFAAVGAARYLGDGRTAEPSAVAAAVHELLADAEARRRLGSTAAAVIDGAGADRIVTAIERLRAAREGATTQPPA